MIFRIECQSKPSFDDYTSSHGLMLKQVCYVAFWDEVTLAAQEAEGKVIGDDSMIGRWRIIVVRSLPFVDQRLNGKIPKVEILRCHNLSSVPICHDRNSHSHFPKPDILFLGLGNKVCSDTKSLNMIFADVDSSPFHRGKVLYMG